MKNLGKLIALSLFLVPLYVRADMQEIAFSIQNNQLTWFEVADPSQQGNIDVTGLPGNANTFDGNALAWDPGLQRLLFVNSADTGNRTLYSVNLAGATYQPGVDINAGAATALSLTFQSNNNQPGFFGADFYNGSYYALEQGTNTLVQVNFNGNGTINGSPGANIITLPKNNPGDNNFPNEFLGDIAFKLTQTGADLFISGQNANEDPASNPQDARIWHYSTTNGTTFTSAAGNPIVPNQVRYNGIFFSQNGTLYGYRLVNDDFGIINQTTGTFTETSTGVNGVPFTGGGDLAPGPLANVVPEPSTFGLLGFGALLLTGIIRRSRAH